MTTRKLLAAAAFAAGLAASATPARAAEPTAARPTFAFGTMKAMSPEAAKAKAEAWLKAAGKFDEAAFKQIWSAPDRSVLDQVADSLALGHPEAKAVLADVRNPETPAPTEVPAFLKKDAKLEPFFRANVALAFAKAASKKVAVKVIPEAGGRKEIKLVTAPAYEEALAALADSDAAQCVDPASFYFFKAVAEHAIMKREAALTSIAKLRDVTDTPHRYTQVSLLMLEDMFTWSPDPKDFGNIGRLMDNSGRRLDLTRPDEKTQDIQKKIVFRLDEAIKDLENKQKQQQQQANGGGQPNGGGCPNGQPGPGNQPGPAQGFPSNPAADSTLGGGMSGQGKVIEQRLREYRETWGLLPPEKRAKIMEEMQREVPAQYKPMIDSYFKSLNKLNGFDR